MNLLWNRHRASLLGWREEGGVYLSLICLAFQNESCKLLRLLSINTPRQHIFKLKNNTETGVSIHKAPTLVEQWVAMMKMQLKSHMKSLPVVQWDSKTLSPPIDNWTKCLTCLKREFGQFMAWLVQSRSLDSTTSEYWLRRLCDGLFI